LAALQHQPQSQFLELRPLVLQPLEGVLVPSQLQRQLRQVQCLGVQTQPRRTLSPHLEALHPRKPPKQQLQQPPQPQPQRPQYLEAGLSPQYLVGPLQRPHLEVLEEPHQVKNLQ